MTDTWTGSISLHEARQNLNPWPSVSSKCRKAYEKEYGEYNGEYVGEIGWAEITETN